MQFLAQGAATRVQQDWCSFWLEVPPRAFSMISSFVSYYGCPSNVISSILEEGQLLRLGGGGGG